MYIRGKCTQNENFNDLYGHLTTHILESSLLNNVVVSFLNMLANTIGVFTAQSCKYRISAGRGLKLFNINCQLYREEHVSLLEPTLNKITKFIS